MSRWRRPLSTRRRRAAVVGGGIGGLTAAGFLAHAGLAVTLFEAQDEVGGKARGICRDGLRLDLGPTLLALPEVVHETFAALGAADLLPPLHELELQCAYRFADGGGFHARRDLARMADEAAALHPADRQGLQAFYAEAEALWRAAGEPYLEAPFEGLGGFMLRVARRGPRAVWRGVRMGTLAALAARHLRAPGLRQFVGRFATYVGAAPDEVSAAFALIPHLERASGVWHPQGGMSALVDALRRAIVRLGVRVVCGTRAGWAARGGALVVGPPGAADVEVDAVVVNADPLGQDPPGPLALSGYVLALEVPRRLELPHHLVWFSSDYRREFAQLRAGMPAREPTIYACHPVATDPSMAPAGRSGVYLMVNAPPLPHDGPAGPRDGPWPHAAQVREQCLQRLDAEQPGIARDAIVHAERTPVDFAREGAPRGSLYGFLPRGRFGPFRRPRMRSGLPGVFYAGGGTHPGGGVPMVMLSGRYAAQMALRYLEGR